MSVQIIGLTWWPVVCSSSCSPLLVSPSPARPSSPLPFCSSCSRPGWWFLHSALEAATASRRRETEKYKKQEFKNPYRTKEKNRIIHGLAHISFKGAMKLKKKVNLRSFLMTCINKGLTTLMWQYVTSQCGPVCFEPDTLPNYAMWQSFRRKLFVDFGKLNKNC